jgi:cysteine sulfinate desulfinase/cysteine desulfurase-like protein
VATLIGADRKEDIIFTSGATESNNIAIKGVARFYKAKKKHIVTTVTVRYIYFSYIDIQDCRNINVFWILVDHWNKKDSKLPI